MQESKTVKFGDCLEEFLFSPGITNLNHGSYGSTPKYVLEKQHSIQYEIESCPDKWFRETNRPRWMECLADLADFLSVDATNLVFVQNTTTGINSILRSYPYSDGDGILNCNLAYNAIVNTVRSVVDYHKDKNVQMYMVELTFPIKDVQVDVVDKFRQMLIAHGNIKIAVIDHITSGTACLLPVSDLITLCKQHGVISVIDGAHAVGQILDIHIPALAPHAYTGSLHKWCYCSKSCGFIWFNPSPPSGLRGRGGGCDGDGPAAGASGGGDIGEWLRPTVTSHFYKRSKQDEYFLQGTRDDSSYLTTTHAIHFINLMCHGLTAIHAYNTSLLDKACEMLVTRWGTGMLEIPESMVAPYLRMVALPPLPMYTNTHEGSVDLLHDLRRRHDLIVVVLYVQGRLYVRLSAQIFNTLADYERLADIIDRYRLARAEGAGAAGVKQPVEDFTTHGMKNGEMLPVPLAHLLSKVPVYCVM